MLPLLRRYRLFIVVALFLILTFYYLRRVEESSAFIPSHSGANVKFHDPHADKPQPQPQPQGASPPGRASPDSKDRPGQPLKEQDSKDFPKIALPGHTSKQSSLKVPTPTTKVSIKPSKTSLPETIPKFNPGQLHDDKLKQIGQPGNGIDFSLGTPSPVHWEKPKEHFPVPSTAIITLPTGKAKRIPAVQDASFEKNKDLGSAQEDRLKTVRDTFKKHWKGYKQFAWEHDELKPFSGGFADPFAGWRATLVDSLDTLWIMGLKDDFDEAVNATGTIDFTTTSRPTLPLFEVTIRYLGGLISAYDVSGGKYAVLLNKAEELAEVLFGAFDTPNRMPQTNFNWMPSAAKYPHVAPSSVVLAELGSLSMEFTRLAQLTGRQKYYDAIARITNELEGMQDNTTLPGLWPVMIDTSGGCELRDESFASSASRGPSNAMAHDNFGSRLLHSGPGADLDLKNTRQEPYVEVPYHDLYPGKSPPSSIISASTTIPTYHPYKPPSNKPIDDCVIDGLKPAMGMNGNRFTLGGMADSVYEYLPKEYALLGGREEQYRRMHTYSVKTWKEYLLIRAMTPEPNRKLLFAGDFTASGFKDEKSGQQIGSFRPTTGHLDCFLGAYVGLGARVFGIEKDMEFAKQLTDGCVWAYESTLSGIMPENFEPVKCPHYDGSCPWNETAWHDAMDPYAQSRVDSNILFKQREKEELLKAQAALTASSATSSTAGIATPAPAMHVANKRQDAAAVNVLGAANAAQEMAALAGHDPLDVGAANRDKFLHASSQSPTKTTPTSTTSSSTRVMDFNEPTTYAEMMELNLYVNPLPKGMAKISSSEYILRPEAIESVFYMWRLTGDTYWREKGWAMFTAIDKHTTTKYGNSAIRDVMSADTPGIKDAAESFWTAETLKYFYLLFADVQLMSLDKFVFNTEAHPFLRPTD